MRDPIRPFRWDISRREQLGRLVEGVETGFYEGFHGDLVTACARVLALAGDADLVFVGRSPERLFDFLSGALRRTGWESRLTLLHASIRATEPDEAERRFFREYLASLGLTPRVIERGPRPIAFVDAVHTGGTLGFLVTLLREWPAPDASSWRALRPRIRLVGLTPEGKTSPKKWRWQQHSEWVGVLPRAAVRNVSIPWRLWDELVIFGPKSTAPFPPWRWIDETVREPLRDADAIAGLAGALEVYELGRSRAGREALAARLTKERGALRRPWLRSLVLELRRS